MKRNLQYLQYYSFSSMKRVIVVVTETCHDAKTRSPPHCFGWQMCVERKPTESNQGTWEIVKHFSNQETTMFFCLEALAPFFILWCISIKSSCWLIFVIFVSILDIRQETLLFIEERKRKQTQLSFKHQKQTWVWWSLPNSALTGTKSINQTH